MKKKLIAILTVLALSTTMLTCTAAAENEPDMTEAIVTEAPETEAPETEAPETEAPETEAPETEAPETEAPETETTEEEANGDDSDTVLEEALERKEVGWDTTRYGSGNYSFYKSYSSYGKLCKIVDYSGGASDTDVVIPEYFGNYKVVEIGASAFSNCSAIVNITIPITVTNIDNAAFYNCSALKTVNFGTGVKIIDSYAFEYCRSLESITLPKNLSTFNRTAFQGCIKLKNIEISSDNTTFKSVDGVLFTKDLTALLAYPMGKTNESYTIPSSVERISSYAFFESPLKTVTIQKGTKVIADYAFYNNDNLTNVAISDTVTTIGSCAFYDCDALTKVTIPDSVLSIGSSAFNDCDKLSTVVIGSGVTSIASGAFTDCPVKNIYYTGTEKDLSYVTFNSCGLDKSKVICNYIPAPKFTSKEVLTGNAVKLTWTKESAATSYRVYRSTSLTGKKTMLGAVTTTTFTDTATAPGTKYYYFVTSYNSNSKKESPYSDSWIVNTYAAPTKPTGVKALSGGGNATITWNAADGATSYRVYRSTSPTGTKNRVAIRTSTYYVDKNATTGLTYYYWVQAYNANSGISSEYSAYSSAKIVNTFDKTPIIKSASVLSTSVTLKWDHIPGATSYQIYRRKDNGDRQLIATQSANEFKDSGLTKGKTYRYEIRAYSSKTKTTTVFSPIKFARPMAAPTITSGNVLGKITWDKNAVATSYRVYRADSLTGAKKLLKPVTTLSYTDTTAESGKTYYYFVAAYDSKTGTLSAYSQPKVIKIA